MSNGRRDREGPEATDDPYDVDRVVEEAIETFEHEDEETDAGPASEADAPPP